MKSKNPTKTIRKNETIKRRSKIKKQITELGMWNLNKSYLAKKYNVSWHTIQNDFKRIGESLNLRDLNNIELNLSIAFRKVICELMKILNNKSSTASEKIKASNTLGSIISHYIKMLEAFGIKKKVPAELAINNGDCLSYEELKKIYDECQEEEKEEK